MASAGQTTIKWITTTSKGYWGIQAYNRNNELVLNKPIKYYASGSGFFRINNDVGRILFTSNNADGWDGRFEVMVSGKSTQFTCTNCLSGSKSLDIGSVWIDHNFNGGRVNGVAHCVDECEFLISQFDHRPATNIKWITTSSKGYWGIQAYNHKNEFVLDKPIKYYASGSGFFHINDDVARIIFTSDNTDGWDGRFEVTVSGNSSQFTCTNCLSGSKSLDISSVWIDHNFNGGRVNGVAHCVDECEFRL